MDELKKLIDEIVADGIEYQNQIQEELIKRNGVTADEIVKGKYIIRIEDDPLGIKKEVILCKIVPIDFIKICLK